MSRSYYFTEQISKWEITKSYRKYMFSFIRNWKNIFKVVVPICITSRKYENSSCSASSWTSVSFSERFIHSSSVVVFQGTFNLSPSGVYLNYLFIFKIWMLILQSLCFWSKLIFSSNNILSDMRLSNISSQSMTCVYS